MGCISPTPNTRISSQPGPMAGARVATRTLRAPTRYWKLKEGETSVNGGAQGTKEEGQEGTGCSA